MHPHLLSMVPETKEEGEKELWSAASSPFP